MTPEDASIAEFETCPIDNISTNAYSRRSYIESHQGETPYREPSNLTVKVEVRDGLC